mmetsp:Transcript_1864/g.6913  ORF Transcript_1864/g.6913 Transcript_1864/m.6913 type:complete len:211 (+) Transcript_1864:4677-5309(+)
MYCVICVVFPLPVSPTTTTIWFSRMTCIKSSRHPYTGKNSRCCFIVFVFANSLCALDFPSFMCSANFEPALKSISPSAPTTSGLSSSRSLAACACTAASVSSAFVVPVIDPILLPFISQNLSRPLFSSRFVRTSFTNALPFRAICAKSLVMSFTGNTVSCCFVNTMRPSKNGGLVSCTSNIARFSSVSSKSKSISFMRMTPDVIILFSSH